MRSNLSAAILAALIICGLTGCGGLWPWGDDSDEVSQVRDDVNVYACAGGKRLMLGYDEEGKSVMVVFPEREFRLDRAASAPGKKYSNGRTTLTMEGDTLALEEAGAALFSGCKLDPAFPPPMSRAVAEALKGVPPP
jgi:membrane-bound inhibitor of C-type lysozyme